MDIHITKIKSTNKNTERYEISGKDINVGIINGIRRIAKKFIPTIGFNINNIEIINNTSNVYNNSYMSERLQHLPVLNMNKKLLTPTDTYEMYIDYENTDTKIYNLTTKQAQCQFNGKPIKYDKEILIIKMKPNTRFTAHLKADIDIGDNNVIYDGCHNIWHEIINENKFIINIIPNEQLTAKELLIETSKYFIDKYNKYKEIYKYNLENNIFHIEDEDDEILINIEDDISVGIIMNNELQKNQEVILSGINRHDQFKKTSLLKIFLKEKKNKTEKIGKILNNILDINIKRFEEIIKIINKI